MTNSYILIIKHDHVLSCVLQRCGARGEVGAPALAPVRAVSGPDTGRVAKETIALGLARIGSPATWTYRVSSVGILL